MSQSCQYVRQAAAAISAVAVTCAVGGEAGAVSVGPGSLQGAEFSSDGAYDLHSFDLDGDGRNDFSVYYYGPVAGGYVVAPPSQTAVFPGGGIANQNPTTRIVGTYTPNNILGYPAYELRPTRFDTVEDALKGAVNFTAPDDFSAFTAYDYSAFSTGGYQAFTFENLDGVKLVGAVAIDFDGTTSPRSRLFIEDSYFEVASLVGTPGVPPIIDPPTDPGDGGGNNNGGNNGGGSNGGDNNGGNGGGVTPGTPNMIPTPTTAALGSALLVGLAFRRRRSE